MMLNSQMSAHAWIESYSYNGELGPRTGPPDAVAAGNDGGRAAMGLAEMISFGGGVNSTAMTIMLVEQGWRGPIVFADVGQPGEHAETLCYLDYFEREVLCPVGLELTRLPPGSPWHSKKASMGLYDYCTSLHIIPLTAVRWCSVEWKRDPLERWRKAHGIELAYIGIDAGETRRVRDDPAVRYPLVDAGLDRARCERFLVERGIAVPPKSGCFFCPNQRLSQWRRLLLDHPDLYALAEALEENAGHAHNKHATLDAHGESLAAKRTRRAWDGQMEFDLPDMARPCICGL